MNGVSLWDSEDEADEEHEDPDKKERVDSNDQ